MNYEDLLLPKLSGADVRVYAALRIIESAKGKGFSVYRKTINKICGVDRRFISKAIIKLKRMGIIGYKLKVEKLIDKRGRFIKGSYKTRYADINILQDVFSVNRQTADVQRLTVGQQASNGPSDTQCQPPHRQTGSESPSSKEEVAEHPASASGEAVGTTVPAVEKKKESRGDEDDLKHLHEDPLLASMLASFGGVRGEAPTALPPHTGVAMRPPPPEEAKLRFSKVELGYQSLEGLTETLTQIRHGLPLAGKNGASKA
jgi:hypothetical protein